MKISFGKVIFFSFSTYWFALVEYIKKIKLFPIKTNWQIWGIGIGFCFFVFFIFSFCCHFLILCLSSESIAENITNLNESKVGLVLGCSPLLKNGSKNYFFEARMNAVLQLYNAGKIHFILVSGDNRTHDYNEPAAMKAWLMNRGIPQNRIFQDFAGFRTLDSVVRANKIFGQSELIIISQKFHVQRALYIARRAGINATGFCAEDATGWNQRKVLVREFFSRIMAVIDVELIGTNPKFLGSPIQIGMILNPHSFLI